MPPVPQACQPIADDVASLESQEQQLRAQLATLTGAAAWAALAQLGQVRQQLVRRRADLDACVRDNSAALMATLVVIDVGPASPTQTRVATLWEITPTGATRRENAAVNADSFSFVGPLPATFGVTVPTGGEAMILGPDFRTGQLTTAALPAPDAVRAEVVLGPLVRLEPSDLARLASTFTPTTSHIESGPVEADLSTTSVSAELMHGAVVVRATGQVDVRTVFGLGDRGAFAASATLRLVPSSAPGSTDLVDLLKVSDVLVQLPGLAGQLVDQVLPLIRNFLEDLLSTQLRNLLRTELPAAVSRSFLLAGLPPDVVLSIRRLSIEPSALEFQPTLSALGTALSTFTPPAVPPP